MSIDKSSGRSDQGAKHLSQDQTADQTELSLQDAQQRIHELQASQRDLEMQNAALLTAQIQLEREHRKYRNLFEVSSVGLLVLDPEACIREANLTFAQMLGIEVSELIGRRLSDFVAPDWQDTYKFFLQRLRTSKQTQQCEINLIHDDLFVVKLHGLPLSEDGENARYYVAVCNMTAEKQFEIDSLEQAVESQRIKILADFVNATSHDLRTPLTQLMFRSSCASLQLSQEIDRIR